MKNEHQISRSQDPPGIRDRGSEARLLDALYDIVLVTDGAGRLLDVNGRGERKLGLSRRGLAGRSVAEVIDGFTPEVVAGIHRHLARGAFTVVEGYCRPRGRPGFLAEMTVGRWGENGDGSLLFTLRNIEPRRRTQERLRAVSNAMENAASAMVIAGADGRILRVNRAFRDLWQVEPSRNLEGVGLRDFWAGANLPDDLLERPFSGEVWSGEVEAVTARGRALRLQVSAAPNRDASEDPAGAVYSLQDVTAQRKAEAALRREAETQLSRARSANEFSGWLAVLGLPDLVQLIASTRKTGTLSLTDGAGRTLGSIGFGEGEVYTARCGETSGEEAFFALLHVGGEGFRFEAVAPGAREEGIRAGTMALLLEGVRRLDEACAGTAAGGRGEERLAPGNSAG